MLHNEENYNSYVLGRPVSGPGMSGRVPPWTPRHSTGGSVVWELAPPLQLTLKAFTADWSQGYWLRGSGDCNLGCLGLQFPPVVFLTQDFTGRSAAH